MKTNKTIIMHSARIFSIIFSSHWMLFYFLLNIKNVTLQNRPELDESKIRYLNCMKKLVDLGFNKSNFKFPLMST